MIRKSMPKHGIHSHQKISRNIWYNSSCQGTAPGQRMPHTIHDSKSLPKQVVSGQRKIFTQHTIQTSFPRQVIPGKWKTSRNTWPKIPVKTGRFRSTKPHTTWDSNNPVKAGSFWSTKSLTQHTTQNPRPRYLQTLSMKSAIDCYGIYGTQNTCITPNEATYEPSVMQTLN